MLLLDPLDDLDGIGHEGAIMRSDVPTSIGPAEAPAQALGNVSWWQPLPTSSEFLSGFHIHDGMLF
jgi:hypothetical protein